MVRQFEPFSEPIFLYTYDAVTCMYDCASQHVFFAYKFTGKERDTESGLDDFGAWG